MARPWQSESPGEADARFPSGRWAGYWQQAGVRGNMQLELTFGDGRLFGDGRDFVGDFVLSGGYTPDSGGCTIHKAYLGQHGVEYDGMATERGIHGVWRITSPIGTQAGVFHIWPVGPQAGKELMCRQSRVSGG